MTCVIRIGRAAAFLGAAASGFSTTTALAHGYAGKRFFPATITNDDPFVADELSLPTASWFRNGERPAEGETDVSAEFSKRILDNLGVSFEGTWTHLDRRNEQNKSGFQNLETTLKYQFFTDAEHEAIVSAGLGVEWGDTGARKVGAESLSVLTPTVFFGKGAGDLPDDVAWLRPLAITGLVGYAVPTDERHTTRSVDERANSSGRSKSMRSRWSTASRWNTACLTFKRTSAMSVYRVLPIGSFPSSSFPSKRRFSTRRGRERQPSSIPVSSGIGQYFQVGAEAVVPLNRETGTGVGVIGQLHFYLDDLFPTTIGKPIF